LKKNLVPLLGVAFVVAILATGVFYGLFVGKIRASNSSALQPVVFAARTLERGTGLSAADLKIVALPPDAVPKGALSRLEDAVKMVPIGTVQENEPLLAHRLGSAGARGGASLVPAGMRAISVHVADSSGVVAMLQPGQKVDVQVVHLAIGPRTEPELRTLLQNVEVLSVTQPDQGRPVVNLLTAPADADRLGLADSTARIRLTLRNPLDDQQPARSVVSGRSLRGDTTSSAAGNAPLLARTR
jgi:pilus assembly protein CpaB